MRQAATTISKWDNFQKLEQKLENRNNFLRADCVTRIRNIMFQAEISVSSNFIRLAENYMRFLYYSFAAFSLLLSLSSLVTM